MLQLLLYTSHLHHLGKGKGAFLYSVVVSPGLYTSPPGRPVPLHFTPSPWQTCSFQHQLNMSGKNSATLQLLRIGYSLKYPLPSIARYSVIQLSELEQGGVDEIVQSLKQQQDDSNPYSLDRESDVLISV